MNMGGAARSPGPYGVFKMRFEWWIVGICAVGFLVFWYLVLKIPVRIEYDTP
jgi:hypothetical protein